MRAEPALELIETSTAAAASPITSGKPERRSDFLLFSPPAIGAEEIDEVVDTLRSGWITTGPKTRHFEAEFRKRVDAPDALGLNSCTAGLHVGLLALGRPAVHEFRPSASGTHAPQACTSDSWPWASARAT